MSVAVQDGASSGADAPAPARRKAPGLRRRLATVAVYLVMPVGLLALWQVASDLGWISAYLLPSPRRAATGFWEILTDGTLWMHVRASLFRSIAGFLIATSIAVPLGVIVGWSPVVRRLSHITLLLLIPIPITAWISIAIVWFGIGDASAVFLVALGAAVPILINTIHGVEWVEPVYVEAARMLGTGPRQILWRVVLPAALPNIFTGLRLGLRNSWAGLVVAEMIGAKSGVGYLIWDARLMMRSDLVIVGMMMVGVLGLVSDQTMSWAGRRVLRWHEGLSRND
ncbi:ABC transporter permease [Rhodoplanes sp. SY1]|uniref:ABC transporter permease n=1 Tax=Rhodoplanes sp. SY1 TaxID=3166646 RepID=UPI0038B60C80